MAEIGDEEVFIIKIGAATATVRRDLSLCKAVYDEDTKEKEGSTTSMKTPCRIGGDLGYMKPTFLGKNGTCQAEA